MALARRSPSDDITADRSPIPREQELQVRPLTIIGIILAALGAFVLLNGASFTRNREVLKVGPVEASVQEKEAIPGWAGGVALVLGIGLVVAGAKRRA
jgi:hypothetical protein